MTASTARHPEQIDRLLDAIDLLKAEQREDARALLRGLIQEDSDFEDAWLWMSVAVDSLDESMVCLDNVLRINPKNPEAVHAYSRIRAPDILQTRRRFQIKFWRDILVSVMWLLIVGSLCSSVMNIFTAYY